MHLRSDYLIKYFQMLNFTGRGVLFEDNLSILTSSQFDCLKIKRFYRGGKKTKMGENQSASNANQPHSACPGSSP